MALRRLVRLASSSAANWSTEATETFDSGMPADSPSSWGTTGEVANLDRLLTETGSLKSHLGLLATFTPSAPDRFFGAIVKVIPTYDSATETPQLSLWTKDATSGMWTERRQIPFNNAVRGTRSGEAKIFDLTLAVGVENVSAVWITMEPDGTSSLAWVVCHLYGECDEILPTPDCPPFSNPAGCVPECDVILPSWECDPDDPPDVDFNFPGFTVEVPLDDPSHWAFFPGGPANAHHGTVVPFVATSGPTRIQMYFGAIGTGGKVQVTVHPETAVLFGFQEGLSQTATVSGDVLNWTCERGYRPSVSDPSNIDYLPPTNVVPTAKFIFTPKADLSVIELLDVLFFYWTAFIDHAEVV